MTQSHTMQYTIKVIKY